MRPRVHKRKGLILLPGNLVVERKMINSSVSETFFGTHSISFEYFVDGCRFFPGDWRHIGAWGSGPFRGSWRVHQGFCSIDDKRRRRFDLAILLRVTNAN